MTYKDQLNTPEWRARRSQIIKRDHCLCQLCKNENILKEGIVASPLGINSNKDGVWFYVSYNNNHLFKHFNFSEIVTNPNFLFYPGKPVNIFYKERDKELFVLGVQRVKHDLSSQLTEVDSKMREWEKKIATAHPLDRISFQNKYKEFERKHLELKILQKDYSIQTLDWYFVPLLQVHHKYYQKTKLAWEYPDDVLITFCSYCHSDWHKKNPIEERDQYGRVIRNLTPCRRCNGVGYIPPYDHVQNGICFRCWGAQYEEYITN